MGNDSPGSEPNPKLFESRFLSTGRGPGSELPADGTGNEGVGDKAKALCPAKSQGKNSRHILSGMLQSSVAAVSSGPRTNVVLGKGLVNEGVSDFTPHLHTAQQRLLPQLT